MGIWAHEHSLPVAKGSIAVTILLLAGGIALALYAFGSGLQKSLDKLLLGIVLAIPLAAGVVVLFLNAAIRGLH